MKVFSKTVVSILVCLFGWVTYSQELSVNIRSTKSDVSVPKLAKEAVQVLVSGKKIHLTSLSGKSMVLTHEVGSFAGKLISENFTDGKVSQGLWKVNDAGMLCWQYSLGSNEECAPVRLAESQPYLILKKDSDGTWFKVLLKVE